MMGKLEYKITTLSPLIFSSSGGETNTVFTKEYIPGTIILGMMAGKYIKKENLKNNAHAYDFFYECFLNGSVRFGNAYIVAIDNGGRIKKNYPLPLSLHQSKYAKNMIYDLLLTDEDFDKQTRAVSGFGHIEGGSVFKREVKKSLNFHHEHDVKTGAVKKEMFFNYQSIDAEQVFSGIISGDEKYMKDLKRMFSSEEILYIGRSRSSQYGKIKFEILEQKDDTDSSKEIIEDSEKEISLSMLSNTIIYDRNGFPSTDPKVLENEFRINHGIDLKIKKSFIKSSEVENFVSIWRLRRPSETCFSSGSCFLLDISNLSIEQRKELLKLERNGIGERKGEGFGEIIFGLQKRSPLNAGSIDEVKPAKPDDIPTEVKVVLKLIVKDSVKKQVESMALKDSVGFNPLITKSLIGKLEVMTKNMSRCEFQKSIDKFPKTATDNLENCYSQGQQKNLKQFLKEKSITIESIFSQFSKFGEETKKLINESHIDNEFLKEFESELYCQYFLIFFAYMRKRAKIEEKEG